MGGAGRGRWGKRAAMALVGLLICLGLAVGGLFVWLGLDSSRRLLLGFAEEALAGRGLYLKVAETSGQLPFKLRLGGVSLADSGGVWLNLDEATLDFSPFRLFGLTVQVNSLRLDGLRLSRLPVLRGQDGSGPDSGASSPGVFSLPVDIRLDELALEGARVDTGLLRAPPSFGSLAVNARASAEVRRGAIMEPGNITAEVRAEVDTERGRLLALELYAGPDGGLPDALRLNLSLAEAERGLLAGLAGLESLPAYDLRLVSESSLRDIRLDFNLRADLLADLSGRLALAPIGGGALRQDSLERLLTPNWLADLALKARPGPRLFDADGFFAALPASAADLLGPEIDLAVSASSEISGASAAIRFGELRLENSLLAAGLSGSELRLTGRERPRLDFDGDLLARVKDGKFFTLLGLQSAEAPLFGAGSLRLGGRAGLELGGDAPQGEFSFTGPLASESFMGGGNPVNLAFNLEVRGKFSDALTLEALRLEGMGLEITGRSRLVPDPLALEFALEASGREQGEWARALPGLDAVLRDLGFSGVIEARLDAGQNIAGSLGLSLSGLSWPLPELERAVGRHAALLADFSGPLASPYSLNLKGLHTGPEPLAPSACDLEAPFAVSAHMRARGEAEISLPGAGPRVPVQGRSPADLARLLSFSGRLDLDVADVGLFLPESSGFGGAARLAASAGGVAGGEETALRLEARLSSPAGKALESPLGGLDFSLDTFTELALRGGLDLLGKASLKAAAAGAGAVLLEADWEAALPPEGEVRATVRNLRSSFAGLALQGGVEAVLAAGGGRPDLSGRFTARLENWKDFNAALAGLALGAPAVSGTPLELALDLSPSDAGQNAGLSLNLERLHLALDAATDPAALPAPEGGEQPMRLPGLLVVSGISGGAEARDLWNERRVSARLQTGAGSAGSEEWESSALLLDLAGLAGRVNLAVRGDGEALGFLRGLDLYDRAFTPELVDAYLRDDGRPVEGAFAASVGLEAYLDAAEAARAGAGNGTLKMAMLSGVFRLDPLALSLDRAALFLPELGSGLYLLHPAFMRAGDTLRVRNLNFAVLPNGYLRADARFSAGQSRARAEIKDFPLALARRLTGLPLPDGELGLNSRLSVSGGEITGRSDLSAVLRPVGGRFAESDGAMPEMLLSLQGSFDKASGAFKLPTAPGVMRLTGSGSLGARQSGEQTALRLTFDLPFRPDAAGLPRPDPEAQLAAALGWHGDLGQLWPLLPVADKYFGGMAQLDFNLGGNLSRLRYSGSAYLAEGRYEDMALGLELSDINVEAQSGEAGSRLLLAAGDGEGGKIALEARLDDNGVLHTGLDGGPLSAMPALAARGQINSLAPLHRDDVYVRLSGLVDASGPLLSPLVSGKFEVEQGNVNLLYNLGGSVSSLPVEEKSALVAENPPASAGPILDISIEAPRRFFVRGPIIDSEWKASANVSGPASNPAFSALISPVRGNVDLLSRPFALSDGRIDVWSEGGSLGSALDLLLTYNSADLTAEIRAGGSVRRPRLLLSSTPPLPQDQILSRVLFGKDITQLSAIEAVQVADGVRRLMTLGQGGFDLLGEMRDMLGVDTLRIGSSGGGGAQTGNISGSPDASAFGVSGGDSEADAAGATVEAGKYINDSIYVGVEQGTTENSTRVRVEVELTPNLTFQGSSGGNSSQVGLGWKKDY